MALQYSVAVRDAQLDAVETTTGASATLRIYTGTAPASCAAAATGTLLAEMSLPADWMSASSSGTKSLLGTWQEASAVGAGTAGYFRIWNTGVTTCHIQGDVTGTGGGGEIELTNTNIAVGQEVNITQFDLTAGNA